MVIIDVVNNQLITKLCTKKKKTLALIIFPRFRSETIYVTSVLVDSPNGQHVVRGSTIPTSPVPNSYAYASDRQYFCVERSLYDYYTNTPKLQWRPTNSCDISGLAGQPFSHRFRKLLSLAPAVGPPAARSFPADVLARQTTSSCPSSQL